MVQKFSKGAGPAVHRIDLTCEQSGFRVPPADVHLKLLPPSVAGGPWTLLAYAAAGRPSKLGPWIRQLPGFVDLRVEPGLAPRFMRATLEAPPAPWAIATPFVKVHHVDVGADDQVSWYVEGPRPRIAALLKALQPTQAPEPVAVRCRPVHLAARPAPLSRRQFDAVAVAVSLGYYDIPHRIDLRSIAQRTGGSLGAISELLRRAEAAIITHYVDASLMGWPASADQPPNPFVAVQDLLPLADPGATVNGSGARNGSSGGKTNGGKNGNGAKNGNGEGRNHNGNGPRNGNGG